MLLAGITAAYFFSMASPVYYQVNVSFTGDIYIIGSKAKGVDASMLVKVQGETPDDEMHPRATSEIQTFELTLNGNKMPFDAKSVQTIFPKSTATFQSSGELLKTDAPDVKMPIRLPGLDPKRFPDITYMPIQFPAEGIEVGKSWTFTKKFNGSDVEYTITPTAQGTGHLLMTIKAEQVDVILEDENGAPTTDIQKAVVQWACKLSAVGKADFRTDIGQLNTLSLEATSHRVRVKGRSTSPTQDLTTKLEVKAIPAPSK